jgi:formylglycine-generating enzyme required for sulfatase activity
MFAMKGLLLLLSLAILALLGLLQIEFLPATAAPAPKAPPKTITNSIGMKFTYIPPGKFTMGSPKDEKYRSADEEEHEVEITKGFHMCVYEVTQQQYEKVMGKNPSYFRKDGDGKDEVKDQDTNDFPVENVSWEDAQVFIKKLNNLPAEKAKGRMYRLPTEAEWEYSCRGGSGVTTTFHFGNSLSSSQANFDGNFPYGAAAEGKCLERTCKVGSYKPNGFGLYDMHGNVFEWCQDYYDKKFYSTSSKKDPVNTKEGPDRSFRGGSWCYSGKLCRSALRRRLGPAARYDIVGFRVALVAAR